MKHERKKIGQETEFKILGYLMDNPEAKDTLEGILDWWLMKQELRHHVEMVREALEKLIGNNLLVEHKGIDGKKYYQLNREKIFVISQLIAKE